MESSGVHVPQGLLTHLRPHREGTPGELGDPAAFWYAVAAVVAFAVPLVGSSILGLQHDLYLGIYFVAIGGLLWAYATATQLDVRSLLRRNWNLGVALGFVLGVLLVRNVLSEHVTPHPSGAYYWFELVWRGGIYGAVDALLYSRSCRVSSSTGRSAATCAPGA